MNDLETRDDELTRRREEIKLFLGKASEKLRAGGGPSYDLATEFRKTKKNFSPLVPLSVAGVILFFIAASWLVTGAIDRQARRVSVDIQAFEDLKLKDLLDQAKNTLDELDAASSDLAATDYAMNAEIARIREGLASDLTLADALAPDEAEKRKASLRSAAAAKERAVMAEYGPRLDQKRVAVKALQERAAAYDARSVEEAQKQQEVLDNQQKLFELEKTNLTAGYEARLASAAAALKTEKADGAARLKNAIAELTDRYEGELAAQAASHKTEVESLTARFNPVWTDERGAALGAADAEAPRPASIGVPSSAPAGSPVQLPELVAAAKRYADLRYAIGRLRDIPYINSVPGALASADEAAADLAAKYQSLVAAASSANRGAADRIAKVDRSLSAALDRIDSYAYALSGFARTENEAGFVIDGRNPKRVLVYVDPLFTIADGTSAWIFRSEVQPIAVAKLRKDGDAFIAEVERMEEGFELRPFDRVLLQLTGTANSGAKE